MTHPRVLALGLEIGREGVYDERHSTRRHTPLVAFTFSFFPPRESSRMIQSISTHASTSWLHQTWLRQLRACAHDLGLGYEPVPVLGWMLGRDLIACVRHLGGEVRPAAPFHHWTIQTHLEEQERLNRYVEDLTVGNTAVGDFMGFVEIVLDGASFLALRIDHVIRYRFAEQYTILAGATLEDTLRLADRLSAAHSTLCDDTLRVFGGSAIRFRRPQTISEGDLILPDQLKTDLLGYLDAFRHGVERCAELEIAPSRGVLLVGAPGTGKTLSVRHLLDRFSDWRTYLYLKSSHGSTSAFEEMVDAIAGEERPVLVIIEDIDRILESQGLTAEYFLNVLDGLLAPTAPVLWIATSNDPTGIEENLLDRPGRFDRVFVFNRPEAAERRRLIEHYSPWPVAEGLLSRLAAVEAGLCGSHIREICHSA